jgi:copper(I)-binding protein
LNRIHRTIFCALAGLALGGLHSAALAHEYYGKGFTLIHPWAEPSAPHATAASVFMHFEGVAQGDRLLRARSDIAASVELQGRGGKPAPKGIEIRPETVLTAEGPHLVLTGLTAPLQLGRSYPLTLVFEKSGTMNVMVSIGAH